MWSEIKLYLIICLMTSIGFVAGIFMQKKNDEFCFKEKTAIVQSCGDAWLKSPLTPEEIALVK